MLESILIVGGVMLFLAVIIIAPFIIVFFLSRYDWRLRKITKAETEVHYSKITWWKGTIYLLSLGLLFIAIALYFAVRKITYNNIGILDFIIVFGAFSFLYSKAKKIKLKKKEEGFGFYLVEEVKKEDFLTSDQVVKSSSIWNRKEGLKEIITRPPFTPQIPIGRKDFFLGYLIAVMAGFLIGVVYYILFGAWIGKGTIVVGSIISIPGSYIIATWCVKRFIDIRPTINTKMVQIILFILFLLVSILGSILAFLTNEFKNSIIVGSLNENLFGVLKTISTFVYIIWIPLLLFILFLLFKRGHETHVANYVDYENKTADGPVLESGQIASKDLPGTSFWIKYKKVALLLAVFVGTMLVLWFLFGGGLSFLSNQNAFEKKKECERLGNYVYQDFKTRYGVENVEMPEYIHNPKLDICLTYISYSPNSRVLREVVVDALSREELTSYYWAAERDAEESKKDKEAFDSSKKIYFSGDIPALK